MNLEMVELITRELPVGAELPPFLGGSQDVITASLLQKSATSSPPLGRCPCQPRRATDGLTAEDQLNLWTWDSAFSPCRRARGRDYFATS